MIIIAAAALIAIGIVAAAAVYGLANGRLHGGKASTGVRHTSSSALASEELSERAAGLARREEDLAPFAKDIRWERVTPRPGPEWTDDFSNLLGVWKRGE